MGILDLIFSKSFASRVGELREKVVQLNNSRRETLFKSQEYTHVKSEFKDSINDLQKEDLGFLAVESIKRKYNAFMDDYTRFIKKSSVIQEDLRKSIESLLKSEPELPFLLEYDDFIEKGKFGEILVNLTEGFKKGLVSKEDLLELKKYKRLDLSKATVYVKDNRTHYADMILVNDQNEILFVKRNLNDDFEPGKYCLPGGHVEEGENEKYAAVRECEEETGIKLDPEDVIHCGTYLDKECSIQYYCCRFTGDPVVLEEREQVQYEWVPFDKVGEKPLLMNLKENLRTLIDIPVEVMNVNHENMNHFYHELQKNLETVCKAFNNGQLSREKVDEALRSLPEGAVHRYVLKKAKEGPVLRLEIKKSQDKVDKVMREWKEGTLKTGSGERVTDQKQAIAIALSEERDEKKKETKKKVAKAEGEDLDSPGETPEQSTENMSEVEKGKRFSIGYISHREDGDYQKVGAEEWKKLEQKADKDFDEYYNNPPILGELTDERKYILDQYRNVIGFNKRPTTSLKVVEHGTPVHDDLTKEGKTSVFIPLPSFLLGFNRFVERFKGSIDYCTGKLHGKPVFMKPVGKTWKTFDDAKFKKENSVLLTNGNEVKWDTVYLINGDNIKEKVLGGFLKDIYSQQSLLKAYIQYGDQELAMKAMDELEVLQKGKAAEVGEIREWKGQKMRKTAQGWIPVKEDVEPKKEEVEDKKEKDGTENKEKGKLSREQLEEYARKTSQEALEQAAKGADEDLRVVAKKELQRREVEENPENDPEKKNSIESLVGWTPGLEQSIEEYRNKPMKDGLTWEEQALINNYSKQGYQKLNKELRSEHPSEQAVQYNSMLEQALNRLPNYEGETYRAIGIDNVEVFLGDLTGQQEEKGFIQFSTPLSTSERKEVTSKFGGNVLIKIKSKNGKQIKDFARFKNEDEVLMKSSSRYKIQGKPKMKKVKEGPFSEVTTLTLNLVEI